MVNSTCSINEKDVQKNDCPIQNEIHATVEKPLHVQYPGLYEATLRIFDLQDEELSCVDIQFSRKENKKQMVDKELPIIIKNE